MNQTDEERKAARNAPNTWRPPASKAGFLERVFGIKSVAGKIGCMSPLLIPVLLIGYCSHRSAESNRVAAQAEAVQKASDEAAYQERVRTGAVCEDGPNGLNTAFQMNVMRRLKDPDSFQHIGTVITPATKGDGYDALMRYRSKNSFGASVVGTAVGKLYVAEPNVCEVRSFEIEG